jgi:hypothetical protein
MDAATARLGQKAQLLRRDILAAFNPFFPSDDTLVHVESAFAVAEAII